MLSKNYPENQKNGLTLTHNLRSRSWNFIKNYKFQRDLALALYASDSSLDIVIS